MQLLHPYVILLAILVVLLPVGSYFGYESVSALSTTIISDLHITTAEYSLLFSLYSLPNVFLLFLNANLDHEQCFYRLLWSLLAASAWIGLDYLPQPSPVRPSLLEVQLLVWPYI